MRLAVFVLVRWNLNVFLFHVDFQPFEFCNVRLAQLDVLARSALFVGDSSIDVATDRNAGVAVWVLDYGYNQGQAIETCGADRAIQDFGALQVSAAVMRARAG